MQQDLSVQKKKLGEIILQIINEYVFFILGYPLLSFKPELQRQCRVCVFVEVLLFTFKTMSLISALSYTRIISIFNYCP